MQLMSALSFSYTWSRSLNYFFVKNILCQLQLLFSMIIELVSIGQNAEIQMVFIINNFVHVHHVDGCINFHKGDERYCTLS
jgi:hypothetical protein